MTEPPNPFHVDYSIRGTAKCKICKKNIEKGELRIGKSAPYKDRVILQYHHIPCIFKQFHCARSALNIINHIDQIVGFTDLTETDRLYLRNLIDSENSQRKKIPVLAKKKCKERVSPEAPLQTRKTRLKTTNMESINVLFTNADQLTTSKMAELRTRIQQVKPMIVAICEVKPKNSRERHDYNIPGFTLHPVNLDSSAGRGIAVYTHSSLDQSIIQIKPDLSFEEACLLEIRLRGGDLMLFGCIYRSPTLNASSNENNEELNRLMLNISKQSYSHRCLVGDFNFKDICWRTWSTYHDEESKEQRFIETVRDCYYYQHNLENSRRRGNDEPSLIDLIFTDESMQISDVQHQSPLGKSDHNTITFKFNCYLDYSKPQEKYIYEKGDFEAMRKRLADEGWLEEFVAAAEGRSIEQLWDDIKSKIHKLRNEFVPKKKFSAVPQWKNVGAFPVNRNVQKAIQEKHASHRQWMASLRGGDPELAKQSYQKATNKVKKMVRQCKRQFESWLAEEAKTNPKPFYSHVRGRLKTKEGVGPLVSDPEDWKREFVSVC